MAKVKQSMKAHALGNSKKKKCALKKPVTQTGQTQVVYGKK